MKFNFSSGFVKTILAVTLSIWATGLATAQGTIQHRSGKNLAATLGGQTKHLSKISALVSRPGNSQDFSTMGGGTWQHETNSAYTYDTQGRLTLRLYTDPVTL